VLPVGKHFPGHGRAAADTHHAVAVGAPTRAALADELAPFAALAPSLPALMGAHVSYLGSALPGTLDPAISTTLLRDELGFRGALLSDNLEMGAVAGAFSVEDAAVRALAAGCDALLFCHRPDSFPRAHAALLAALRDPGATALRRRLAEAADRLRALRAARPAHAAPPLATLGSPEHQALAASVPP
jgi:beta-N-acetylhexosaminidase